ncbi:MAG: creatininase family protein [Sedimentibacter sp.]
MSSHFSYRRYGSEEKTYSLCKKFQRESGVKCAQIDWWRFAAANSDDILQYKGQMAHGHASECGTSVMFCLRPDLVDMEKAEKVPPKSEYSSLKNASTE